MKMLSTITTAENRKLTQQATFVVRFQYRPYRNGARNAPASAPQDTPMSWAMNVALLELVALRELRYWKTAIAAERTMNTTTNTRMQNTCFFSSMSFTKLSFRKSMVMVELDASTSEDSVDMEADRTRITTMAIRMSGRPDSIVGITAS